MTIAALLCAWLAGVCLGWQLGWRHRRISEEEGFWVRLGGLRSVQYDWSKELEL